jgi:hypothetical protein
LITTDKKNRREINKKNDKIQEIWILA